MTLDPTESWIIHEVTVRPCDYADLASKALSERIVDSEEDLNFILERMEDRRLIHFGPDVITSMMVPYDELRTDVRDTEIVLQSAIRKGGLTVRQVNRCGIILSAIREFFEDEQREVSE